MAETTLKLKNAPIIEAILDIECEMPLLSDFQTLEQAVRDAYIPQYPKFRQTFLQQHCIEANPPHMPQVTSKQQSIFGFQFLRDDERQLVQVRVSGFSFNRLAPYSSLDDYISEIKRTWGLFLRIASPISVKSISLRYINRILLPTPEIGLSLSNYFRICPHLPNEDQLAFVGFFNQHAAVERKTGHNVNIILATQVLENNRLPIIFDITVVHLEYLEPQNWNDIEARIQSLRRLKNDVFRNTLTEECINLFQV